MTVFAEIHPSEWYSISIMKSGGPEERNIAALDIKDAVIADRDPVGISAEILKDTLGAIEGRFAIDNPLLMVNNL